MGETDVEIIMLALLVAGLFGWFVLGVEDARHWKNNQPEMMRVEVPVMFVDSAYPKRQSLPWVEGVSAAA